MSSVSVFAVNEKFKIFEKTIRASAGKSLRALEKEENAVQIYLIGNAQMRFLNKKFRGKNKSTDVLSFKEPKSFPRPELEELRGEREKRKVKPIGEIYLNIPYIKKEARKSKTHYSFLIIQLLVHGLLHLLGYNHYKKSDRIKMERQERWLISKLVN